MSLTPQIIRSLIILLAGMGLTVAAVSRAQSPCATPKQEAPLQALGPAPRYEGLVIAKPEGVTRPATTGLAVNTADRRAVVAFYYTVYTPALAVPAGWSGAIAGCVPGDTTTDYQDATARMINYFRAMTGLPGNIVLDPTLNAKNQQAALMMIAEGNLSHSPDTSWACYTAAGAEAAGKSNIAIGYAGPAAVAGYMSDPGAGNTAVGHRRWLLYPPQQTMGTGSTTGDKSFYHGSNTIWVFANIGGARPPAPEWVAWPPAGFVPYQVVYPRWSFSRPSADFSAATVTMTRGADSISVNRLPIANGYGDNTIAWEPQGLSVGAPASDTTYSIQIGNVKIGAETRSFNYQVTMIDPSAMPTVQNAAWSWTCYW